MVPEPAPEKTRLAQLASSSKFTVRQLKISATFSLLLLIADTGWKCKPLKMQDPIAPWSATIILRRKELNEETKQLRLWMQRNQKQKWKCANFDIAMPKEHIWWLSAVFIYISATNDDYLLILFIQTSFRRDPKRVFLRSWQKVTKLVITTLYCENNLSLRCYWHNIVS